MSSKERVVTCLVTGIFFALFFAATRINFYTLALDSAFMVEMIDTTFQYGIPSTHLTKSSILAIDTLLSRPAKEVCALPLTPESPELMNEFDRHSFLVVYLTVPFRFLFGAKPIAFFLSALGYVGLLLVAYVILRKRGVPVWPSLAMVFLVSAHPNWSQSAFGQLGPDRYFPPLGVLYMFLLYERLTEEKIRSRVIIAVALLSILVTERTSLMIGASTIGFLVLYRGLRGWKRSDSLLLGIAALAIAYPLIYTALFQHNPDYASFRTSMDYFLRDVLHKPGYAGLIGTFLLINIPLFGIFAVFEWRLALIAFGALLPNILGTNGGAEKTGWTTHYHLLYFPFLVAAVLFGFANLWKRARSAPRRRYALAAVPLALGLILLCLNPFSGIADLTFSAANIRTYAVWRTLRPEITRSDFYRKVARFVPPHAEVTTNELMIPSLYGDHAIHVYPLGLGTSEYAVLPFTRRENGGVRFEGAVSYLGEAELRKLNDCLNDRIRAAGYEVVALQPDNQPAGYAILKLNRKN